MNKKSIEIKPRSLVISDVSEKNKIESKEEKIKKSKELVKLYVERRAKLIESQPIPIPIQIPISIPIPIQNNGNGNGNGKGNGNTSPLPEKSIEPTGVLPEKSEIFDVFGNLEIEQSNVEIIKPETTLEYKITASMLEEKLKELDVPFPEENKNEGNILNSLIETLFLYLINVPFKELKEIYFIDNRVSYSKKDYVIEMINSFNFYVKLSYVKDYVRLKIPDSVLNYKLSEKADLINFDIFKELKQIEHDVQNIYVISSKLSVGCPSMLLKQNFDDVFRRLKFMKIFVSSDVGFRDTDIKEKVWIKYMGDHKVGHCKVCNRRIKRTKSMVTQVISKSNDGKEKVENLRPTCRRCFEQIGESKNMEEYCHENFPNSLYLQELIAINNTTRKLILSSDMNSDTFIVNSKPKKSKVRFMDADDNDDDNHKNN